MLVELPHLRVDGGGIELGPGELVERGDDADVAGGFGVGAAHRLCQVADVAGPDVARAGGERNDER